MKRFSYLIVLFTMPYIAMSDTIPSVLLQEGINTISVSISNELEQEINGMRFNINDNALPSWMDIRSLSKDIDLPPRSAYSESIKLQVEVINPPPGAHVEIPYTLEDDQGNIWNYSIRFSVEKNNEAIEQHITALYENYPNPFNPKTTIKYSLDSRVSTKIVIYNALGQKVKTLIDAPQGAGVHTIQWDGTNDFNKKVSSGIYICKMTAGVYSQSHRMMLIK